MISRSGQWGSFVTTCQWLTTALIGEHGLLSHFPILILGVGGVGAVMHRHWPSPIKMLAACSLVGATGAVTLMCWNRRDWVDAMFAIRWLVPLLPLLLFWAGAWMRRSHARIVWVVAGLLLSWSAIIALLGATNPVPRGGFSGYTARQAFQRLFQQPPLVRDQSLLAGS
ncbi:MAG: hypothetical protein JO353_05085 [Phycisphaerae bacterium]|nr:hypothetical protein [Phycisphaerae bacterium]